MIIKISVGNPPLRTAATMVKAPRKKAVTTTKYKTSWLELVPIQ
jgi:hypothetical protein